MADYNNVNTYYKHLIEQESKKLNNLKHTYGTVVEIVVPKNTGVARVNVMGRTLRLLNKTGETVEVGDSVIIHYWDNVANGYIALRCGAPALEHGMHIKNAAVVDHDSESLYTQDETVFNIDEENVLTEKYSHADNIVLVNGNPAIYVPHQAQTSDFETILRKVDKRLFTDRITVNCKYLQGTYLHYQEVIGERTLRAGIGQVKYFDTSTKACQIGCYMDEDYDWRIDSGISTSNNVYFTDLSILKNIGIVIAYQSIITSVSEDFPYGYVIGYPVIRCGINNDGYDIYNGTRKDLFLGINKNYSSNYYAMYFGFRNEDEARYAITVTQRTELKVMR